MKFDQFFDTSFDQFFLAVLDYGIEDAVKLGITDGVMETALYCDPRNLASLTHAISNYSASEVTLVSSDLIYRPVDPRARIAEDADEAEKLMETVEKLVKDVEEHEDTLRVWTTLELDE